MFSFRRFSWVRFLSAIFQAFGVLWLIIEITDYFFANSKWTEFVKSIWWLFCISGIVVGTLWARPKRLVAARIKGTDIIVEVRIGDILKQEGAIIVGSNTTFDTNVSDGTISPYSLQGQFTIKYFYTHATLDRSLTDSLDTVSVTSRRTLDDKPYGKVEEYELGTVAPIVVGEHGIYDKKRKAYFVAIARMNSDRVASSDTNALQDALPRIWNGIRNRGGMEDLLCPVLGSGYSRLSLTRQELVQAIIRSFVAASLEGKLTEKLSVIIHPKDLKQGQLDLDDLQKFLEYECVCMDGFHRCQNHLQEYHFHKQNFRNGVVLLNNPHAPSVPLQRAAT